MNSKSGVVDFLSGFGAGISNVLICAPLDTARTRLQIQGLYQKKYTGMLQALKTIYKTQGVKGLYRGSSISIIAFPTSWSIYFYFYEKFKIMHLDGIRSDLVRNIVCSSSAGVISSVITNPLWLLRVRMQASSHHISGLSYLKELVGKEGVLSLYRGISTSLLGVVHVAVYFPLYEVFKEQLFVDKKPSFLGVLIATWIPKLIASLCSYPNEVMRARIYTHNKEADKRFKGLFGLFKYTFKTEGIRGFYGGFFGNLLRILPSTFVTFYTYEKVRDYFKNN